MFGPWSVKCDIPGPVLVVGHAEDHQDDGQQPEHHRHHDHRQLRVHLRCNDKIKR